MSKTPSDKRALFWLREVTKVFSGEQSTGPVYQNHEQIRGAKAEPDDSHDAMMD